MRLKHKLPRKKEIASYEDMALLINDIVDSLVWICPTLNRDIGTIEPPAEFLRDGLLAYADNDNWAPGAQKGIFRYNGATSNWDLVG
jgi:hypothetical protein